MKFIIIDEITKFTKTDFNYLLNRTRMNNFKNEEPLVDWNNSTNEMMIVFIGTMIIFAIVIWTGLVYLIINWFSSFF